ncbi:unnamed protein product [Peniophora sp. CBMAI 1063]|nr:unnamed protein product [Peniophora sp. CBMAI 1063]
MWGSSSLHQESNAQFRQELKAHAGDVDTVLVQLRRERCRRYLHPVPKVHLLCDPSSLDAGRSVIRCSRLHPGDIQGSGSLYEFVSPPLNPVVLQELRDRRLARELQWEDEMLRRRTTTMQVRMILSASRGMVLTQVRKLSPASREPTSAPLHRRASPYPLASAASRAARVTQPAISSAVKTHDPLLAGVWRGFGSSGTSRTLLQAIPSSSRAAGHLHAETVDVGRLNTRSRSPSIEIIEPEMLSLWFFIEDRKPPLLLRFPSPVAKGASFSLAPFSHEWDKVGVKSGDVVKLLTLSSERLPIWAPVLLTDLILPVGPKTVVAAHIRVRVFHPRLDEFRNLAVVGFRRLHDHNIPKMKR